MNAFSHSSETSSNLHPYAKLLSEAEAACRLAGSIQSQAYGKPIDYSTKSTPVDLVTEVDRACDEAIRNHLSQAFPEHLLLTEETYVDGTPVDLSNTWVVDPLDGTTNFTHGFPFFAVSIAYVRNGSPEVGVVYDVTRDECFSAIRGQGAWLNGRPIQISATASLSQCLLATGFPYDHRIRPEDNIPFFLAFMSRCHGVRRAGSAALDLCYVACGRLDGFWELRLGPWDVAAGALIVEEAGGKVTTLTGDTVDYSQRKISILGANPATGVLDEMLSVCRDTPTHKSDSVYTG
ncbi:MAG: inositol monophosphatase family protein [Candidatus Melainabacteria bacterium]|nr:inositol monophosphatase family protein [Candidatus Melainabacteria bacterium]